MGVMSKNSVSFAWRRDTKPWFEAVRKPTSSQMWWLMPVTSAELCECVCVCIT